MRNHSVHARPLPLLPQFAAFSLVFSSFFIFSVRLTADVIYLDENGKVISSENAKEPVVYDPSSPSASTEREKAPFDPDHPGLDYSGISVYYSSNSAPDKVVFRSAPPEAVDLVIPDGVTEIGPGAFSGCTQLKSVVFPNSLNFIPASCFPSFRFGNTLRSVSIPAHASIGDQAFMFCQALESVTITKGGETVAPPMENAHIGREAFSSCFALKRFEFPDGIRSIGDNAFLSCPLESVILPDSVTSIGENAFSGTAIKTLKLPAGIKTIGDRAFLGCPSLEDFELPPGRIDIGRNAFSNCFGLRRFKVPQGSLAKLPDGLFENCRNLESVELPDGLAAIGEKAFETCSALKEINLPDGVETIGYRAFAGCENLENIVLPANLKKIGFSAFRYCPKLKRIALPEGVETFADAFDLSVTHLTLPAGNTRYKFTPEGALIDDADHVLLAFPCAFQGHYTIPDGVRAVAPRAFRGCSLRGVTIPSSVTSLGSSAFAYSALEEIAIPSSVTEFQVGENIPGMTQNASAFEVTVPEHNEEYDRSLFAHCTRLKRVTLPENMTEIPFGMFKQCHSLEEIAIPSGVKAIDECAFLDCRALKRIVLPSGVRMLPPRAFDGCKSLAEVRLPDGLESIDYYAFRGCAALTELAVPNSVKTINDFAFEGSACEKNLHDLIESLGELHAAEEGDMDLQYKMGYLYQFGIAFQKDVAEAVNWYLRAAEQGQEDAQFMLDEALEELKAEEICDMDLQCRIGDLYQRGVTLRKDAGEAAIWYRKAAAQGHAEAQFKLGAGYENGEGVEQDLNEAAIWYRKAAEQGHAEAKQALERLQNPPGSRPVPKD